MKNKLDLFTQFGKMKDQFKEIPRDQLWDKLEEKLDNKKNVRKLHFYRMTSYAAIFVGLIAAVMFLNHYLKEHNPKLFVSNEGFTSLVLEDLANSDESFFNTESITLIHQAYAKVEDSNILSQLPGKYSSFDAKNYFTISIENYSYTLEFESVSEESYILNEIEGLEITFRSEGGDVKTLIKEGKGMKIVESNDYDSGEMYRKVSEI